MVVSDIFFDLGPKLITGLREVATIFTDVKVVLMSFVGSLRDLGLIPRFIEEQTNLLDLFPDTAVQEYSLIEYLMGPGLTILVAYLLLRGLAKLFLS